MTPNSAPDPRPEPVARYTRTAMTLHWVVAAFITIAIVAGLAGANAPESEQRRFVELHKSLGLTILALVLLRVLWRIAHKPPPMPRAYSKLERKAAHWAHWVLYALMLALPLTGYIHDSAWKEADSHPILLYGLVHVPRIGPIHDLDFGTREHVHDLFFAVHVYFGYILYALLALHLLGVAKHHAVDHQEELQRMLPETYRRPDAAD